MGVRSATLKDHGDDFAWSLLDASPDATVIVSNTGEIVFVNDQAGPLFGFDGSDLLGRKVEELLPVELAKVHRAHRTRYQARPTVRTMGAGLDLWARRADGSEFPVEIALSPLRLGAEVFVVAAVRDVTERVESEAQMQRVLRTLDATDDGIFIFDAVSMVFSFVNEGAVRLTGYDRAELLTMSSLYLNPNSTEAEYRGLVDALTEDGSLSVVRRATLVRKDGSKVAVEKIYRSAFTGRDKNAWVITLARDITARQHDQDALEEAATQLRDLNAELARSNTELEQFAYIASHDLQEPLRHISAFAQKFADRYSGVTDERGDRYIGYIIDGSKHLQALIAGLLEFSRVGRSALHRQPVELDELVAAAIRGVSITARDANAVVTPGPLPIVNGDRDLLYRLFINLLSNAIKFARPNQPSRVHITAATNAEGCHEVCVADNGIGIAPEYRERVFEIFERLNGHDYPGTGIGLSVARRIVHAHDATMKLTESLAGGSLVTITFPNIGTTAQGAPHD